jgi:histidinol-phosphate phosphatase family protein
MSSSSVVNQVVIVAGGQGSRMTKLLGSQPKCLVKLNGVDLLTQNITRLSKKGFKRFHLLLGVNSQTIIKEIQRISEEVIVEIDFTVELEPKGTGGAILNALDKLDEFFIVIHGDLYIDMNFEELENFLIKKNTGYVQVFHPSTHVFDSDLITIDDSNKITGYHLKPHQKSLVVRNRANAGIYGFNKRELQKLHYDGGKIDLDRELLPKLLNFKITGYGVRNNGFVRDVGTPERLLQTQLDLSKPFRTAERRPTLFLDRDGTLNVEKGYITDKSQIELYPDAVNLIKFCNNTGIRVIVVTNQPVIARGDATFDNLHEIHSRIDQLLSKQDLYIDEYYFCPHHPDSGFEGERIELKISCQCRKPGNGLILKAGYDFKVDYNFSLLVGDRASDIECGEKSGIKTIFLSRNNSKLDEDIQPNFIVSSLDQVILILQKELLAHIP